MGYRGLGDVGASLRQQGMVDPNLETDSCVFGRIGLCVVVDLRFGFGACPEPGLYLLSVLRRPELDWVNKGRLAK